jgi:hypothetical protein
MSKVLLYVYDISQGMAKQMSMAIIGKQIDYIPHTGIVAFGKEYFFQSSPAIGVPGQTVGIPTCQVIELGETMKTSAELEAYINASLVSEYNEATYQFLNHNCNNYSDAVSKFLLDGKGIPNNIVNMAQEALSEPKAQPIRMMIENMEKQMRSQMGGASALNPFGNQGSPGMPVAPAPAPTPAPATNEDLEAALAELKSNDKEVQRACLSTLVKITENVDKNPVEAKFRKLKNSNGAFKKKVLECPGGVEAMLAVGWNPDVDPEGEDCWILGDEHARSQSAPLKRLAAALSDLGPAPGATPAITRQAPPTAPATTPGGYGGMGGGMPPGGGFPGMGGLPPGMANNPMMQQMMNNPAMMAQAQQMMQNPQMMAQMQQMMNDPNAMAQMQNMMGGGGGFR